ncbi:uncharacterized protein LOC123544234 isoform X4 [Mercenaria mercenaria]|uniref:uncharacterized protein LOC123544234 isoform X4 n=1 Tax=Mercenaria mercenaria TaxID=6596 RepID=UPI00234F1AD0|nr:uncharacterized protein LOC123544234 isoform X4 [Mercenaria mercenaria]
MMEDWLFGSGDTQFDERMAPKFTDNCNRWMTLPEERGLSLNLYDLKKYMDPVMVAVVLHQGQFLPQSTYRDVMNMFQKGITRERICEYLIKQLPSAVSLHILTRVLDKCGYRNLSTLLVFNSYKWNSAYTCVSNPSSYSNLRAYTLYINIKRLVNNGQLNKPRRFLRKMANRCYVTMTKETDPRRKQSLADQCIAIIGAETDIIAITFDKTLCRHVLFTQMKRVSRETSNTLISDLVYYGRLANAYAIAGLGNRATVIQNCPIDESCITEAKTLFEEFDKYWDGTEKRRRMFYYVAKARLCELEERHLDSLQYLKLAYVTSMKGNFEETKYISAYYHKLIETERNTESRRRENMKLCDQIYFNPNECRAQKEVYHDHEVKREEDHIIKTLKYPDIAVIKRQTNQMFSSPQSARRFQPIEGSNVSQSIQCFKTEFKMEGIISKQHQETDLSLTKYSGDDRYFPSLERSPPSGDSQPDSPVVSIFKNSGNDTQLKYAARASEAGSKIKNVSYLEQENGTCQIKDNNNVDLGYSGDTFSTYDVNTVSYITLNPSSMMQETSV